MPSATTKQVLATLEKVLRKEVDPDELLKERGKDPDRHQQTGGGAARRVGWMRLFYKVAISVPRGMAKNRHDDDKSEEQRREAEQGEEDDQRSPQQ